MQQNADNKNHRGEHGGVMFRRCAWSRLRPLAFISSVRAAVSVGYALAGTMIGLRGDLLGSNVGVDLAVGLMQLLPRVPICSCWHTDLLSRSVVFRVREMSVPCFDEVVDDRLYICRMPPIC